MRGIGILLMLPIGLKFWYVLTVRRYNQLQGRVVVHHHSSALFVFVVRISYRRSKKAVLRQQHRGQNRTHENTSRSIRCGEITKEQFDQMSQDLQVPLLLLNGNAELSNDCQVQLNEKSTFSELTPGLWGRETICDLWEFGNG